ncbi:glutaredoxin family protein [Halobacillus sp. A5]|uniref:glutaredoxin family protein n=1 Tax=Halobacillus sp. A5 TaxID=2880263 RepID=UPI0020A631B9|nr:glutaredoxin family protein [Halobacillus sp. A5]MCP3028172.1 glutaredoxin family protein [Halobacillus sp. A5]
MNKIIVYRKESCSLCDEVESLIEILQEDYIIDVSKIDIEGNIELEHKFMLEIPVLVINGEELEYRHLDLSAVRERLH